MNRLFIGLAIRAARTALHMSQSQLADILGVSQSTISNIENGSDIPGGELLQQIEQVLGMKGEYNTTGQRKNSKSRNSHPTYQTNINIKVASDNQTGSCGEKRQSRQEGQKNREDQEPWEGQGPRGEKNPKSKQQPYEEQTSPEENLREGQNPAGGESLQQKFDAAPTKKKAVEKTELPPDLDYRRTALMKQLRKNMASLNRMEEAEFGEFLQSLNTLQRYMLETERPNAALKIIFKDL